MATVVGPLFSLAASGTYRNELVFRSFSGSTYVSTMPKITGDRSVAQKDNENRVSSMASSWTALSIQDRQLWANAAQSQGMTGYKYFFREWFSQNIVAPALPVIP